MCSSRNVFLKKFCFSEIVEIHLKVTIEKVKKIVNNIITNLAVQLFVLYHMEQLLQYMLAFDILYLSGRAKIKLHLQNPPHFMSYSRILPQLL